VGAYACPGHWSQIAWVLSVCSLTNIDKADLRTVRLYHVGNEITLALASHAVPEVNNACETFLSNQNGLYALLASPNGRGIPRLRLGNKHALCGKIVKSVSVLRAADATMDPLTFRIELELYNRRSERD